MKKCILLFVLFVSFNFLGLTAQGSVDIDGRLQPILNDFFEQCKKYNIDYHAKLFQLKTIEFAHHFLDYKHTCQDCNEIMAVTNESYFEVAKDWDAQVEQLFTTSPVYLLQQKKDPIVSTSSYE